MPFKSEAQRRLCWAKKSQGEAGSWDCEEWEKKTKKKKSLPYKIKESILLSKIDKAIAEMDHKLTGRSGMPKVTEMDERPNTVKREKKRHTKIPSDSTTRLLHKISSSLKKAK